MGIIDFARSDWAKLSQDKTTGPGVVITLISPGGTEYEISGIHTKHHFTVDSEGKLSNSLNAHISFSESISPDIRDANGKVNMRNWKVRVADSTGSDKTYAVREWFPDETTGMIVITLGAFV